MKLVSHMMRGAILLALSGCNTADPGLDRSHQLNSWMVNTLKNTAIENAIISQHTLYDYHFVPDSEKLNELGLADLGILASHFRTSTGSLNIRRGETTEELYDSRVREVKELLGKAGVDAKRVRFEDRLPGGDGAPSSRVLSSLEETPQADSSSSMPGTKIPAKIPQGVK